MNDTTLHRAYVAGAIVLVSIVGGCWQRADSSSQSASASRAAELSPEESFQVIVDKFKQGVQDVPSFVVEEAGGHTMMSGQNTVAHELIRPAKEGESYRGIITVASESRYSIQRPIKTGDDASTNERDANNPPSENASGVEIFDSSLVGAPDADSQEASQSARSDASEVTVARKVDAQERIYELVYKNGRWELKTKLDPQTEKSIEYAFERALETQS
jgi:hypothetical protein